MEPITIAAIYIFGFFITGHAVSENCPLSPSSAGVTMTTVSMTWPVSAPILALSGACASDRDETASEWGAE